MLMNTTGQLHAPPVTTWYVPPIISGPHTSVTAGSPSPRYFSGQV